MSERVKRIAVIILGASMFVAASRQPPLIGTWGGGRAVLTATVDSVSLTEDCQTTVHDGPLRPDARGHFSAAFTREIDSPGPQPVDVAPRAIVVQVAGQVGAGGVHLTVTPPNGTPENHDLVAGRRIKRVRCM